MDVGGLQALGAELGALDGLRRNKGKDFQYPAESAVPVRSGAEEGGEIELSADNRKI